MIPGSMLRYDLTMLRSGANTTPKRMPNTMLAAIRIRTARKKLRRLRLPVPNAHTKHITSPTIGMAVTIKYPSHPSVLTTVDCPTDERVVLDCACFVFI